MGNDKEDHGGRRMNKQKRYKVDRNKVMNELAMVGVHNLSQLAADSGYSAGWAANQLLTPEGINGPLLKVLEGLGISYESIKPDEPNPEKEKPVAKAPEPKTVKDITLNELYSVMFRAFRDALKSE